VVSRLRVESVLRDRAPFRRGDFEAVVGIEEDEISAAELSHGAPMPGLSFGTGDKIVVKKRLGRQKAEALDVGERALRRRGKVTDPLDKLQISGLPSAASEMMALLAVVVSRPVDVLGFGQIPIDA